MTSPGLKRPLDIEFISSQSTDQIDITEGSATSAAEVLVKTEAIFKKEHGNSNSPQDHENVTIKRRCTDTYSSHTSPTNMDHVIDNQPISRVDTSGSQTNLQQMQLFSQQQLNSPLMPQSRDSPTDVNSPLDEDINTLIKEELSRAHQGNLDPNNQTPAIMDEPLVLTERQTYSICEKLIRNRERKLGEQYDRKLAQKLAEQYDLFAKANYLNMFAESARVPAGLQPILPPTAPLPPTTAAVAAMTGAAEHPSIKNAMAAAFLQRSVASPVVSPNSTPSPLLSAATSMPNITSMAASLAVNGHSVALTSPHHHHATAYNLQQHQAAAAAVLRHAQQQQQQQHHQQQQLQQTQQRRISALPNNPIPLGPVLLASSLDEQLAVPEALFTLFGVFGDVIRVKILFNKKDNALIQMADANQAQVAQAYLDKQKIFGKVVRVSPSKHQIVQMPRDGSQSDAGLTKDFTNSPLHRFKIPGSRNYSNIYPPSNTLHISNIPSNVDEKDLHQAFKEQCEFEFSSFKFFPNRDQTGTPKDRKMALMRFSSIEQATIALIKMHNFQMSEENNLRVSFSKSAL